MNQYSHKTLNFKTVSFRPSSIRNVLFCPMRSKRYKSTESARLYMSFPKRYLDKHIDRYLAYTQTFTFNPQNHSFICSHPFFHLFVRDWVIELIVFADEIMVVSDEMSPGMTLKPIFLTLNWFVFVLYTFIPCLSLYLRIIDVVVHIWSLLFLHIVIMMWVLS